MITHRPFSFCLQMSNKYFSNFFPARKILFILPFSMGICLILASSILLLLGIFNSLFVGT